MVLNTMLMSLLVAIYAMAGIQHLLVFARNSRAIEHVWFGIACVAAAGAALAMSSVYRDAVSPDAVMLLEVPRFLAAGWLVAATWLGL